MSLQRANQPVPVPFRVSQCSSEEPDHPSRNLDLNLPQSRGWISGRSPPARFPQELVLQCAPATLTHLRLMSHHCKISTRVELFARGDGSGDGSGASSTAWVRIGHFSLDSNVRSNFQTRELRTVSLPPTPFVVTELRFLLHEPHANDFNSFNQVGIVSINILGIEFVERMPQQQQQQQQLLQQAPMGGSGGGGQLQIGQQLGQAPQFAQGAPPSPMLARGGGGRAPTRAAASAVTVGGACGALLAQLLDAKARAVAEEDFATAQRMKKSEMVVRGHAAELTALDARKKQAVAAEEYEQATIAKQEMSRVQATVAALAQRLGLGGGAAAAPSQPLQQQQQFGQLQAQQYGGGGIPSQLQQQAGWGAQPPMPPQQQQQQQPMYGGAAGYEPYGTAPVGGAQRALPFSAGGDYGADYGAAPQQQQPQPQPQPQSGWVDERPERPLPTTQQQPPLPPVLGQEWDEATLPSSVPGGNFPTSPISSPSQAGGSSGGVAQAVSSSPSSWAERPLPASEAPLPGGSGYNYAAFDEVGPDAVPGAVKLPTLAVSDANADSRWSAEPEPQPRGAPSPISSAPSSPSMTAAGRKRFASGADGANELDDMYAGGSGGGSGGGGGGNGGYGATEFDRGDASDVEREQDGNRSASDFGSPASAASGGSSGGRGRGRGRGQDDGRPELIADLLDGVPGADGLDGTVPPLPEQVHEDVLFALGKSLTACAYDGNWHVRECALLKVVLELNEYIEDEDEVAERSGDRGFLGRHARNPRALVVGIVKLVEHAFGDINAKVFFAGIELLTALLHLNGTVFAVAKHDPRHHLHRVAAALVAKLREANKRCIGPARSALIAIATRVVPVGATLVSNAILRPPTGRTTLRWQELERRLTLTAELVPQLPPDELDSPFGAAPFVKFVRATSALRHSRGEVRSAARLVLIHLATHGRGGTPVLMRTLKATYKEGSDMRKADLPNFEGIEKALRKEVGDGREPPAGALAQRERPLTGNGNGNGGGGGRRAGGGGGMKARAAERRRGGGSGGSGGGADAGRGSAYSAGGAGDTVPGVSNGGWPCQFCGATFDTKEDLDLHFVAQCQMLVSCPRCAQVVPVSDLTEHLLTECEMRDDHGRCPRCNEAVHQKFFRGHVERGACLPARDLRDANRCPFCHEDIEPYQAGWEAHLLSGDCAKNPRAGAGRGSVHLV